MRSSLSGVIYHARETMNPLAKYEMSDVSFLHLKDAEDELMYAEGPDGSPDIGKPMRLGLYGPGSKQYAKAHTAYKNELVAKMARKGGKVKLTADEERELRARFLVGVTKVYENLPGPAEGEDLPAIYTNPKLVFIPEQAEAFARDTANFKPAPTRS